MCVGQGKGKRILMGEGGGRTGGKGGGGEEAERCVCV